MQNWNTDKARKTYNVKHWSEGYFDINDQGHVLARPDSNLPETTIDLPILINEIKKTGLALPVLLRFTDILHDRVRKLAAAFTSAMHDENYQGQYTSVYPIKVNQQSCVVKELLTSDSYNTGLEAGSKPELMAVLAMSKSPGSSIVCNGYKDREYIRLALIGKQLGFKVYLVIEKLSELDLIMEEANKLNIQASIGLRVRLASIGSGMWQNTGGEKSKFGLSACQVLEVIERLKKINRIDTLELLHFHMGSQVPNLRDIQQSMKECARYYAEFHRIGANIRCVDVGGGLGINYDGTHSRNFCSMNYNVTEYASTIVSALSQICHKLDLPHPDIITESGRALTAHHAVLITNVVDTESVNNEKPALVTKSDTSPLSAALEKIHDTLNKEHKPGSIIELYHNAIQHLSEAHDNYIQGELSLQQRSFIEKLYFTICWKIREQLQATTKSHRDILDELNEKLADKYFCNFSIFQSIPDVWAIEQVFPIMPIHRLNDAPLRRVRLHDITCDSDGRIDQYVDAEGIESSLPLHEKKSGEEYLLGIFLVGAYQEILGDIHNLFGDTNSINIKVSEDGSYTLDQATHGDTVSSVLESVKYNVSDLLTAYEEKIAASDLDEQQKTDFLEELRAGISGYTYLED